MPGKGPLHKGLRLQHIIRIYRSSARAGQANENSNETITANVTPMLFILLVPLSGQYLAQNAC